MLKTLLRIEPLLWILFQHLLQQINKQRLAFLQLGCLEIDFTDFVHLEDLLIVFTWKWRLAIQEDVEDNSSRENIAFLVVVLLLFT